MRSRCKGGGAGIESCFCEGSGEEKGRGGMRRSYKELLAVTRGFSEKLGHGSFGAVFRGELPDSSSVDVKRLERPSSRHHIGVRPRGIWHREGRYEKAKQSGASALHETKEAIIHGSDAATTYLAAKGTGAKDTVVHGARIAAEKVAEKGTAAKDYVAEKGQQAYNAAV